MVDIPGERTPDSSPSSRQGSSDDDISLREHMQRQLDTQYRFIERLHTDQAEYFERVIKDMRDLLDQRFAAQQNAVDELKAATADRFGSVNEFRAQLADQARTFISRDESLARHDRTTEQVAEMSKRHETDIRVGRERTDAEIKALRDRHDSDVATINSRLDLGQGRSTGLDKAWGYIVAAIGLAGTVIAILIATR